MELYQGVFSEWSLLQNASNSFQLSSTHFFPVGRIDPHANCGSRSQQKIIKKYLKRKKLEMIKVHMSGRSFWPSTTFKSGIENPKSRCTEGGGKLGYRSDHDK